MCEKSEYIIKYNEKMNGLIGGICLFWLDPPEIHIAEKFKNADIGALILKHELKHLKLYKLIEKHPKYAFFIIIYNDIWDYYDVMRILLIGLIAKFRLLR